MNKTSEMTTLTHILEKLRVKRYDNEFIMTPSGFDVGKGKAYAPEELKIIKPYRFEGDSSPDDSCVLYVIEANDGLIGYTMDAYGVYSNHTDDGYDEFLTKIPVENRDEQMIFS